MSGVPVDTILVGDALKRLRELPDGCVQCCITSPPYWGLRDYGVSGQIGLEESPGEWVERLVPIFEEVRRVLREDGTLWVNVGDCYAGDDKWRGDSGGKNAGSVAGGFSGARRRSGLKRKDLVGQPWMLAFALRASGWFLRSDVIWHKPNPMPEPVVDRPTRSHEYLFLLARSDRYYYDADAVRTPLREKTSTAWGTSRRSKGTDALGTVKADNFARSVPERRPRRKVPGGCETDGDAHGRYHRAGRGSAGASDFRASRKQDGYGRRHVGMHGRYDEGEALGEYVGANLRDVWTVGTAPFREAHFATFPARLIELCVAAGTRAGDLVLDPFMGAGTVGVVCRRMGRHYVGVELNAAYAAMAEARIAREVQPMLLWSPARQAGEDVG